MKTYRSIAMPKVLLFYSLVCVLYIAWMFFPAWQAWSEMRFVAIAIILFPLLMFFPFYVISRKFFYTFEMNEHGIRNRYFSVAWQDVKEIVVWDTVSPFKRILLFFGQKYWLWRFCCIGEHAHERSFESQSPKECIFFALSKRNAKILKKFGMQKSCAIKPFLERYFPELVD